MCKLLKKLLKLSLSLAVVAVAGCAFFYLSRKEHFHSVGDFFEELKGELSTVAFISVFL